MNIVDKINEQISSHKVVLYKDFSHWPTVPQLYINGKFIGGSDIVTEMYESGELQQLLQD